jgi:hypothetical protein
MIEAVDPVEVVTRDMKESIDFDYVRAYIGTAVPR